MTTCNRRSSLLHGEHHLLGTALVAVILACLSIECQAWTINSSRSHQRQERIHFSTFSSSPLRCSRRPLTLLLLQAANTSCNAFKIRKCRYGELSLVSEIIVNSFYDEKMIKSPFAAVLRLGELNRLQQNFPYSDDRHFMFVAIDNSEENEESRTDDEEETIIGFVDLDARPATRRIDPPRPYLSDLAVHPEHRRRGIASTLIKKCEGLAQTTFRKPSLYIRVEQANYAAVQMYEQFEYTQMDHDVFGVEDTTVLLRKDFDETIEEQQGDQNDDDEMEQEDPVLDYVV